MVNLECNIASNIEVDANARLEQDHLVFEYKVKGDLGQIIFPDKKVDNLRKYDLWEHTCFESFIKIGDEKWYLEFNFCPSTEWNCFYIASYRDNTGEYQKLTGVEITQNLQKDCYGLIAKIDISEITIMKLFCLKRIQLGLTAIIEKQDRSLEYWCINKLVGKPDFHNHKTFCDYSLSKE